VPIVGNLYDKQAVVAVSNNDVRESIVVVKPDQKVIQQSYSFPTQLIAWLSKLRKRYGKIFRIFTFGRPYIVLLDKAVSWW